MMLVRIMRSDAVLEPVQLQTAAQRQSRSMQQDSQVVLLDVQFLANLSALPSVHLSQQEHLRDLEDNVLLLGRDYSAPEIKAIIAQCEFFVGSRMHSCIAALSTGVPRIPVSYSHKYAGILKHFGLQDWLVDPKTLSQEQAIDLVLSGYEHREEIRELIIAKLPLIKSEAMRAGQLLKDAIG